MRPLRVLVACEESQRVCLEFRKRGHEAFSCDLLPCSGGHPEWHLQRNVFEVWQDGWDIMVGFPPCTHLAVSGAAWFEEKRKDGRQQQGIDFFMALTKTDIPKWALENPVGIMSNIYREPDIIIQPYRFGDPFQKTTCLWLKGLPKLKATHHDAPLFGETVDKGEQSVYKSGRAMPKWYADSWSLPKEDRAKLRSKTYPGIAKAMAEQWSEDLGNTWNL